MIRAGAATGVVMLIIMASSLLGWILTHTKCAHPDDRVVSVPYPLIRPGDWLYELRHALCGYFSRHARSDSFARPRLSSIG